MFTLFINRPVLSIVISLIITLLGVLAIFQLPVTQYPEIEPPSVTVSTRYTGANAEVCAKAVVTPLEKAINGVPGMTYMTSVSGNDGSSIIQIYFNVGVDPDIAAVNVQNRVSTALDELPEEVIKAGVLTEKQVNSMLMYLNLTSSDSTMDEKFIYNFAEINVQAELKRIDGVGFAEIMGQRKYSMRVWIKPERMAAYNISAEEVIESLRAQNVEAAPGKIGESSGKNAQSLQYVLRYGGKFTRKEQYENIIIKASSNGEILRLKDIAEIEFGSLDYDVLSKENGKASAAIMMKQRPGSNASDVIKNVKAKMEELKATTFPPGMDYTISYDVSRFLDASIYAVIKTLLEAFILVAIVVFIFLQDFKSTLIPTLAVPVSLIGTFYFMQLFGFSINLLTLFALVLAIGIVIDNAIVVVEAVHAKMENDHMDAKTATIESMKEISGAIIAITLVMSAVFIPVAFMSGPAGVFYRQFSITLAISIVISGINALTLTPALCAMMLDNPHEKIRKNNFLTRFFDRFNNWYNNLSRRYRFLIRLVLNRRLITYTSLAFFVFGTYSVSVFLPTGFIPTEDQGTVYVNVTTPSGATLERTESVTDDIQLAAKDLKAVESVSTLAGYNLMTEGSGASFGMGMINLKPWDVRSESVDDVINSLSEKTRHIKDASIQFFPPPAVPGYGNAGGFEFRIQDRTGTGDIQALEKVTKEFLVALNNRKEISGAFTSFDASFPQYLIEIDYEKAAQKGVTVHNAMENLQALIGSYYATNFIRFGLMYKVMIQALPKYRAQPDDILKLYVKNDIGELVPYSAFTTIKRVYGPEQLTRYNMYLSAMVNGDAAEGYSSGDAIKAIQQVASESLPRGYSYDWSGMTREEISSGEQAIYIFIICLVFVYLLLAAQYESFLLPLPVILSLPTGIFGAYFLLLLLGLENNIYAQVALVMLIGLLGKNAILIVEFAIQKRREGLSPYHAAIQGAASRLRPILMTSFAFIAGLIPLMVASGAGAIGNRTIGTAAAGGMLFGTIFGVIIIPGLYVIFENMSLNFKFKTPSKPKKITKSELLENIKPNIIIGIMVLASILASCTPSVMPSKENEKSIPSAYLTSDQDSVNWSEMNWREFFSDSNLVVLIDSAMSNNLDLLTAAQRIEMARAELKFFKGRIFPYVSGVGAAGQRRFGKYTMDGVGNYDVQFSPNITKDQIPPEHLPDYYLGLQTSWEIDVWGKLRNKKKAAYSRFLASQEGKNWLVTNLIAEVAVNYYELLALDSELDIVQENLKLQENELSVSKLQKQAGRSNELAVQQFEAQVFNSKTLEVELRQRIIETENRINFLLGRFPQTIRRNKGAFLEPVPSEVRHGIPSELLRNRPDIRQAEFELIATRSDLKAAKAAFYPSFTINAGLGYQTFNPSYFITPQSIAYSVFGSLTAPLLNRSAIKADFRHAKARQQEAMYHYQKSILNGYIEVYNQLVAIENLNEMYVLKNQQVQILNTSIQTASELFLTGRASYLEVVITRQNMLRSRLELMEIKQRQYISIVNIYKALGGGWR